MTILTSEINKFTHRICDGDIEEAISLLLELRSHIIHSFQQLKTSPAPKKKKVGAVLHNLAGASGLMNLEKLNTYLSYQQALLDNEQPKISKDYLLKVEIHCTHLVDNYISVVNAYTNHSKNGSLS
ncbi:hypothetical protein [Vibrio splendidus]|uniref:hypothetical protein n=1 Tax=Vibrio splendidus TaxID=29497 RepID=UPI000D388DE1|nr:hypothetical protein [Vibrio splendidus]PTP50607.1 hypothetical protein CWO05_19860 [Vibrio splendidus]